MPYSLYRNKAVLRQGLHSISPEGGLRIDRATDLEKRSRGHRREQIFIKKINIF
jgi:hypothetical protein